MICMISFPGGTTVLNTEKPTVIDNTVQPGINKKKKFLLIKIYIYILNSKPKFHARDKIMNCSTS